MAEYREGSKRGDQTITCLLHEALVRGSRVAVCWEEIRQALTQFLVVRRVRREVDQR